MVSVKDVIDDLLGNYFHREEDRIDVSFDDPGIKANVDDIRLTLLLKNLLSNALRYSGDGTGPVELAVTRSANKLVIEVRDRGPGFTADQAEKIGEPFFRGDPSRTRETGGSGLGLYLARLVAEAHGGRLYLREDYREGACLVAELSV